MSGQTVFPELKTARYIILKPNDLKLPYLESAQVMQIPNADNSYVFADLAPEEAAQIEKLLIGTSGTISKNAEISLREDLSMEDDAPLSNEAAKRIGIEAASIYLTNKQRCNNCTTKNPGKPTIFIIMDARISPNKKNKNGQKIFAGLNIEIGPRFAPDDSPPCVDHGNQVLSLYCGKQNYGMIPNCNNIVDKILAIEVFACKSGKTDTENIIKSWLWVADYTLKNRDQYHIIVNESIGGMTALNVGTEQAIASAVNAGAIVFFPSGNVPWNTCEFAPNLKVQGVFPVGGTVNGDQVDYYSGWGPCVKAFFPFQVTDYNGKAIKGTSFSVTLAGALALCILAKNPQLTRDELYIAILSRMTTIDPERWHNYGIPTRITEKTKYCDLPLYTSKKGLLCKTLATEPGTPIASSKNEVCYPSTSPKPK